MQHAVASDYLEESEPAEMPIVVDQPTVYDTENTGTEYIVIPAQETVAPEPCDDELIIPTESTQNLWTDDAIISNGSSVQTVILSPMKNHKVARANKKSAKFQNDTQSLKLDDTDATLGSQTYYGDTIYIVNNFLSGEEAGLANKYGAYANAKMRASYSKCPFNTHSECAVWFSKPVVSEAVVLRSGTDAISHKPEHLGK